MTLEQYWTTLIKRWKLVVLCFLLVGIGAFIGSKLTKPLYQSSALVQVVISSSNNNQANYDNLLASDQLVQTEATLATSDPVLRVVASHYPGLAVSQLMGEVSTSPRTNTQLFEVDVLDPSPTRAARLANDIAATLIKQQQQAIQQNNALAGKQIQITIDSTSKQINDTTEKISALQAKGGNQGQIALLQAQLSGLEQHSSQLQAALAQLELAQAQSSNTLQPAQQAQPAGSPVRPNILLNTGGGLLAGLLLGMLVALLFEQLDTRVRTPEELTRFSAWPVLATIWRVNSSKPEDVINPTGQNANVEPFRILRTNIGFSSIDKPLRSLLVTSALPRDGKSAIAANLAIFMARAGKNTLLIDADLHRPTQHMLFALSSDKLGLSNAVMAFSMLGVLNNPYTHSSISPASTPQKTGAPTMANLSLGPFVHTVGIPNLWVMPSGPLPPNPSEFLESKAMQQFLTVIANCGVEIVVFDTPPLLGLSDTSILSSKVDGVLTVIDMTRATKGKLKQLKAALSQTGANVLGCVANKQRRGRDDSAYSYYYYQAEEQDDSEKQARNGHISPLPGAPLSPMFPSPFEKGRKYN